MSDRREKASDLAALERAYDKHGAGLLRYARALLGSPDDAEDAVQEVFVRLAKDTAKLSRISDLRNYLLRSTRNAAFELLRSRGRRERLQESIERDLGHAEEHSDEAQVEAVLDAFAELPVDQREVLALKVFQGMTFAEIGRVIGKSHNTVSSRYRYAIERIRSIVGSDEDEA